MFKVKTFGFVSLNRIWFLSAASFLICSVLMISAAKASFAMPGTPEEGDTVVGQLQNQYRYAQIVNDERLLQRSAGRRLLCQTWDSRSFSNADHGNNSIQYWMTIFKDYKGRWNVRYEFFKNNQWNVSVVQAGIDTIGFGISGSTGGHCAGLPLVSYFRRLADDSLIYEMILMEPCGSLGRNFTRPVNPVGVEVLQFGVCK